MGKGLRNGYCYSRTVSSVFLFHLSGLCVCLPSPTSCHLSIRAASSPNPVASRSQTPPQYLTVRYVPAILEGWVSHFNRAPSLPPSPLCFAAISSGPSLFSKSTVSVLSSLLGMNGFAAFLELCFHSSGSCGCCNIQLDYSASSRESRTISDWFCLGKG